MAASFEFYAQIASTWSTKREPVAGTASVKPLTKNVFFASKTWGLSVELLPYSSRYAVTASEPGYSLSG